MDKEKTWKRHFSKYNFSLAHPEPVRFVRGPWHDGSGPPVQPLFLAYRLVISIIYLAVLCWTLSSYWDNGKWFIFLTHWGFLFCALQSFFATGILISAYRSQRCANPLFDTEGNYGKMPIFYQIYWMTYNMAVPVAFFITLLYWTILYDPKGDGNVTGGSFALNFMLHAGNSILCLVELTVAGPPSRVLHVLHPFIFAAIYVIFNAIYWAAGGLGISNKPYIYPVMDWEGKPGLGTGIVFGGAILIIALHLFVCMLAGLRSKATRKWRLQGNQIFLSNVPPPNLKTGNVNKAFVL